MIVVCPSLCPEEAVSDGGSSQDQSVSSKQPGTYSAIPLLFADLFDTETWLRNNQSEYWAGKKKDDRLRMGQKSGTSVPHVYYCVPYVNKL